MCLIFCDESPLEIERIKPILRIVEDYPVLTKQQLELAKDHAAYISRNAGTGHTAYDTAGASKRKRKGKKR